MAAAEVRQNDRRNSARSRKLSVPSFLLGVLAALILSELVQDPLTIQQIRGYVNGIGENLTFSPELEKNATGNKIRQDVGNDSYDHAALTTNATREKAILPSRMPPELENNATENKTRQDVGTDSYDHAALTTNTTRVKAILPSSMPPELEKNATGNKIRQNVGKDSYDHAALTTNATRKKVILPSSMPPLMDANNPDLPTFMVWLQKETPQSELSLLLLTRRFEEEKFQLRVPVEYRYCGVDDTENPCPAIDNVNPKAKSETVFQESSGSLVRFQIFQNRTGRMPLERRAAALNRMNIQSNIHSVTYWSEKLQEHIPLASSKNVSVGTCEDESCPIFCPLYPSNTQFKWDPIDHLCKKPVVGGHCRCRNVCFTPEAVAFNTSWPWANASQRDYFLKDAEGQKVVRKKGGDCMKERRTMDFSAKNFSCAPFQNHTKVPVTIGNATVHVDRGQRMQLPCPIHAEFANRMFFIPQAKLIFAGIPKVGITEWIKFFRYTIGAKDYLSLPHYKRDLSAFHMSSLSVAKAEELLNDPTWTKAVFIREPAERLLSAYNDKVVKHGGTQNMFKIDLGSPVETRKMLSFEEFVNRVTEPGSSCDGPNGVGVCTDQHWKPQSLTCGLDFLLPHFDFVGNFRHIGEQTKMLLERVGLWEDYGSKFDDGAGATLTSICYANAPKRPKNHTIHGFNQRGPSRDGYAQHATGSANKLNKLYTPKLLAKVKRAYADDYAIWNELKDREVTDVASGRDFSFVKDFCSS